MAYSEELDLIQNVKNLSNEIAEMTKSFGEIEPSMNQILEMRDQFQELHDSTVAVIDNYQKTLDDKSSEMDELLENCRSQFKQVTDDVESLVNLEVNFESIKDKIETCINLSDTLTGLLEGSIVFMTPDNIVPIDDRLPYKRYLEITDSVSISGSIGGVLKVSPFMGIDFNAP